MHELKINQAKCMDCGTCEILLTGFRSVNNGCVKVRDDEVTEEDVQAAVNLVRLGCRENAITFEKVSD